MANTLVTLPSNGEGIHRNGGMMDEMMAPPNGHVAAEGHAIEIAKVLDGTPLWNGYAVCGDASSREEIGVNVTCWKCIAILA